MLSDAAAASGVHLAVVIEVDVGMTRGGVRSSSEAVRLADEVARFPSLDLSGVMAWEGHCAVLRDRSVRTRCVSAAIERCLEVVDALERAGHEVTVVSAGGTNTYPVTGAHPRVTEIQAGTYALMDTSYESLAPAFSPALTILGTVVNRHDGRIVLDCGSKVQAETSLAPPRTLRGDSTVFEIHEEHALLDDRGSLHKLGDRVELLVSYAAGTVNLHDAYVVCSGTEVVDVWPIVARGQGSPIDGLPA